MPRKLIGFMGLCLGMVVLAQGAFAQAPKTPNDGGKTLAIRAADPSHKWALLVGVNNYVNAASLEYCVADMNAFHAQLLASGFRADHTFMLHDKAKELKNQPLATNISRTVDMLLGESGEKGKKDVKGLVNEGDLVVIAFSGHGVHLDGQSYLCPADAELDKPSTLIPLNRIYRQLGRCGAEVKLIVVDACRNDPRPKGGKSFSAPDNAKSFTTSFESPPKGILVLTSCSPGQQSWEDDDFKHGVFFNYVIEGLRGEADRQKGDRNNRVSLLELYRYAEEKTKLRVADKRSAAQTPRLRGEIEGDWEFGGVAAGLTFAGNKAGEEWNGNGLAMKFRWCPPGKFTMGEPADPEARREKGDPVAVTLTRGFWLGQYEVTQTEWDKIVPKRPWEERERITPSSSKMPASHVAGVVAEAFAKTLTQQERASGRLPIDWEYRLPTEAQWEYACRAGSTTRFFFGDDDAKLVEYAWYNKNSGDVLHEVGSKLPNPWGLYDMYGNLHEWCRDGYAEKLPGGTDPEVDIAAADNKRVFRGGGFGQMDRACRSASRSHQSSGALNKSSGFRLAVVYIGQ